MIIYTEAVAQDKLFKKTVLKDFIVLLRKVFKCLKIMSPELRCNLNHHTLRDDTHMKSTLRAGGGLVKNEMLSDVGGWGLASVLGHLIFFL